MEDDQILRQQNMFVQRKEPVFEAMTGFKEDMDLFERNKRVAAYEKALGETSLKEASSKMRKSYRRDVDALGKKRLDYFLDRQNATEEEVDKEIARRMSDPEASVLFSDYFDKLERVSDKEKKLDKGVAKPTDKDQLEVKSDKEAILDLRVKAEKLFIDRSDMSDEAKEYEKLRYDVSLEAAKESLSKQYLEKVSDPKEKETLEAAIKAYHEKYEELFTKFREKYEKLKLLREAGEKIRVEAKGNLKKDTKAEKISLKTEKEAKIYYAAMKAIHHYSEERAISPETREKFNSKDEKVRTEAFGKLADILLGIKLEDIGNTAWVQQNANKFYNHYAAYRYAVKSKLANMAFLGEEKQADLRLKLEAMKRIFTIYERTPFSSFRKLMPAVHYKKKNDRYMRQINEALAYAEAERLEKERQEKEKREKAKKEKEKKEKEKKEKEKKAREEKAKKDKEDEK